MAIQDSRYRTLLLAQEKELLSALARRDGIAIPGRAPDTMDEVLSANDRDLAVRALDREGALLREVRRALERLANGDFGICATCEESIPRRRLDALPWARLCVYCQEAADRERRKSKTNSQATIRLAA